MSENALDMAMDFIIFLAGLTMLLAISSFLYSAIEMIINMYIR